MTINKVAIIGKGALGLLYGTLISQALGHDSVEYVMDDAHYERHCNDEITVNGIPCTLKTVPEQKARIADLVIVTVKATGLEEALDTLHYVVGPRTCIVSLLNGVTSEQRIAQRFGWERVALSVAQGMDAVFIDNKLTYTHSGEIRFGASELTSPEVITSLDNFYSQVGITHIVEKDIRHRLWVKLMLNVGVNQTCMAYGGNYGSVAMPGEQHRCFIAAMRETLAVAQAEGVMVTEQDLTQMAELEASLDPEGLPSMAQDRINRKPSEVEEFSGTILRLAEKHHILVPQNRWLYDKIREIERNYS